MTGKPEVSVVIPVHNAARTLRACLESVFENEGVAYEVVVVDDASTDDSIAIALEFPCTILVLGHSIRAANCRNLGATHARGDVLLFFDADQIMPPDTVGGLWQALHDDPDVVAAVASLAPDTPEPGFFSQFKNFRHHYVHQQADAEGMTLASGLTAIRRSVFEGYGGFEPAYGPSSIEDVALGYRLARDGRRILFRPDVQVTHLKGYTFRSLLVSEIRDRAIPWTALLLRDRMWRNDLNIGVSNSASVGFAGAGFAALVGLRGWPRAVVPASATAAIWLLNCDLLEAMARRYGPAFLAKALAFLPVMYLYQGLGFVAGIVAHATGRGLHGGSGPTEAPHRVLAGRGLETRNAESGSAR